MIATDPPVIVLPGARIVALGERPAWRLLRHGTWLWLVREPRTVTPLRIVATKRSPFATTIMARTTKGAPMTLTIRFALCRAGDPRTGSRTFSHTAVMSFERILMTGCFLASPPEEKPLLD